MPESRLRRRITFIRKVFFRPLMLIALVSPFSIFVLMSAFVLIRDDFVQPKNPEKWKLVALFHGWPWWVWVIATLVLMILVLVEGTFRYAHPRIEEEQRPLSLEPTAPAEKAQTGSFAPTDSWSTRFVRESHEREERQLRRKALELEVAEREERLRQTQAQATIKHEPSFPYVVVSLVYHDCVSASDPDEIPYPCEYLRFHNVGPEAALGVGIDELPLSRFIKIQNRMDVLERDEKEDAFLQGGLESSIVKLRRAANIPWSEEVRIPMTVRFHDRYGRDRSVRHAVRQRGSDLIIDDIEHKHVEGNYWTEIPDGFRS